MGLRYVKLFSLMIVVATINTPVFNSCGRPLPLTNDLLSIKHPSSSSMYSPGVHTLLDRNGSEFYLNYSTCPVFSVNISIPHTWSICGTQIDGWWLTDGTPYWYANGILNPADFYENGTDQENQWYTTKFIMSPLYVSVLSLDFAVNKSTVDALNQNGKWGFRNIRIFGTDRTPTAEPTAEPTVAPTAEPTVSPTLQPTIPPGSVPTPTSEPTNIPTSVPTDDPTSDPSSSSSSNPSSSPTGIPAVTSTSVPVTPTPSASPTEAPLTPEQEVFKKQSGPTSVITSAAAISGALPAAGAVIVASQPCNVPEEDKFPFPLHPTRMKISGSVAAGAVVGNWLVVGTFALLARVLLFLFEMKLIPESVVPSRLFDGFLDTQGMLRFPSAPLFLYQGLHQGTSVAALLLIRSPPDDLKAVWIVVGVVTIAACVCVPIAVFVETRRSVPMDAVYYPDYVDQSAWTRYWIGEGEWVSVERNNHWINRYASVARAYRQQFVYFSVVQFAASGLFAVVASVSESGVTCVVMKFLMSGTFLGLSALYLITRPYARMCDNHLLAVTYLVQGVSLIFTAVHFLDESSSMLDAASLSHYMVLALLLLKVLLSLAVEIYVFVTKRRVRLQENHWIRKMAVLEPVETTGFEQLGSPIVGKKFSFKLGPTTSGGSSYTSSLVATRHISIGERDSESEQILL